MMSCWFGKLDGVFLICWILKSILLCSSKGYSYEYNPPQNPDYNPDYADYNNGYDYESQKPKTISCYSCTYMYEDGHGQGLANCDIPFSPQGIPFVECTGPCGATYKMTLKPTDPNQKPEFMIVRDCRPNCKEEDTETKFTKCCTTNKCNHFNNSSRKQRGSVSLITLTVALILLPLFLSR